MRRSEHTCGVWIDGEYYDLRVITYPQNVISVFIENNECMNIYLEGNYWNIEYFYDSVRAFEAKIIAYAQELKSEHIYTLIKMTYEMGNYGEVSFEYA